MFTFPPRPIRHVRRPGVCADCGAIIPIGASATMQAGLDGVFWRAYVCPGCEFDDLFEAYQDSQTEKHLQGLL